MYNNISFMPIMYGKYHIKYSILDGIRLYTNTRFVNIYIDLYDILKSVHNCNKDIQVESSVSQIIGSVLSLIVHYKRFLLKNNMIGDITLVYSEPKSNLYISNYGTGYNSTHRDLSDRINLPMVNAFSISKRMIEDIIRSIPNVYIYYNDLEFASTVYKILLSRRLAAASIIVSYSLYSYLLPAKVPSVLLFTKDVGDLPIVGRNVVNKYLTKARDYNKADTMYIHHTYLKYIMWLNGLPDRNVSCVKDISSTLKLLYEFSISEYNTINNFNACRDIIRNAKIDKVDRDELIKRYNIFDLNYIETATNVYGKLDAKTIYSKPDVVDVYGIKEIVEKYLADNIDINLDILLR